MRSDLPDDPTVRRRRRSVATREFAPTTDSHLPPSLAPPPATNRCELSGRGAHVQGGVDTRAGQGQDTCRAWGTRAVIVITRFLAQHINASAVMNLTSFFQVLSVDG